MSLRSLLFRNDAKLQAAAVADAAHITVKAAGSHVAKIQIALLRLGDATIDARELRLSIYGPSTASAVLAYKQKRNIINRNYQTQADNIVGKMTIAALDRELVHIEPLSSHTRIIPLFPVERPPILKAGRQQTGPRLAFQIDSTSFFSDTPQIIVPDEPPPTFSITMREGDTRTSQVINDKGGKVGSSDNTVAIVRDPSEPLAHGGTLSVSKNPQLFNLIGKGIGKATVVATNASRTGLGDMLSVRVQRALPAREVSVAFHFLGGPPTIASNRDRKSIAGAVATMNEIYQDQTRITFRIAEVETTPVTIAEFAKRTQGLLLLTRQRTANWEAVAKRRSASARFNVFFVGKIEVPDAGPFAGAAIALTDTPGKPNFSNRDCIMQDNLKGLDLGLVLAHEAGHAFGADDNLDPGKLMNSAAPGRTIPADVAEQMNKNT